MLHVIMCMHMHMHMHMCMCMHMFVPVHVRCGAVTAGLVAVSAAVAFPHKRKF